jgi:hypothetical protein
LKKEEDLKYKGIHNKKKLLIIHNTI